MILEMIKNVNLICMLRTTGTPPIVLHHKHNFLVKHLFILCALSSVAGIA